MDYTNNFVDIINIFAVFSEHGARTAIAGRGGVRGVVRCIRKLQVDFERRAIETNHGIMQNGSLTYGNAMGTIHTLPEMAELTFKIIKHLLQ